MNKNSVLSKITSCVVTFLLVFSMSVTPAYASELPVAADADAVTEVNQQDETISTPDAASLEDQLSTCRDEDGIGPAESGTENPESDDATIDNRETENPESNTSEDSNDATTGEGDDEDPEESNDPVKDVTPINTEAPLTAVLATSYDSASREIAGVVTIVNVSNHEVENIQFSADCVGSALWSQMGNIAYKDYDKNSGFNLGVNESRSIAFSVDVPAYTELNEADATITVNGSVYIPEGYMINETETSYNVVAVSSVRLPKVDDISLLFGVDSAVCDEAGNPTGADNALPGDIVKITYTITNAGAEDISGASFDAKLPLQLIGNLEEASDIPAGRTVTVQAQYPVTDDDAINGVVTATLLVMVGNTMQDCTTELFKVGNEFDYRIRYFMGSSTEPFQVVENSDFRATLGDVITLTSDQLNAYHPGIGYVVNEPSLTISSKPANNNIDVVYSPVLYAYTLNYYQDGNLIATYTLEAPFGTDIRLDSDTLNLHKPVGYQDLTTSPVLLVTDDVASNVLNVVYSEKQNVGYTIRYFKDSTDSAPLASVTGEAPYNSDLVISTGTASGELNYALPVGYAPLTEGVAYEIRAVASENIFDIVYTEKNFYPLTINYYFDDQEGQPEFSYTTAQTYEYGSTISIDEAVLNIHCPEGYVLKEGYDYTIGTTNTIDVVYSKQQDIAYTINFYAGEVNESSRLGDPIVGTAAYMQDVTPANVNDRKPAFGFDDADNETFVISANSEENVFNVVYPRQSIAYTIKYRTDGFNLDGTHRYNDLEEFVGYAAYDTTIVIPAEVLNAYLPEGYQAKSDADQMTLRVTAEPSDNVAQVTYSPLSIQYTVNYYIDNMDNAPIATEVRNALYGSALDINPVMLNLHRPDGYNPVDEYTRVIDNLTYTNNVIDVVYTNRQTDIPYTIEYYLGSISGERFYTTNGQGVYGDEIPYALPVYQPVGYDYSTPVYTPVTITTRTQDNVLRVVYSPAEYDYTVNYYQDDIENGTFLGSQTGAAAYGTEIPYEVSDFLPEGYDASMVNVIGASTVSTQADSNVLNVVYTTRMNIAYTVNYYGGSMNNLLQSYVGAAEYGTEIPYDIEAIEHNGYEGAPVLSGAMTVSARAAANVLNVVIPNGIYGYQINYYRDQVDPANLLGTDSGAGVYQSAIEARRGAFAPTGYNSNGVVTGAATVTSNEQANVLNVVYSPSSYNYTVRYYRGSIDAANYLGSETPGQGLYGSYVEIATSILNRWLPQGYEPITEGMGLTITANPAANILNVVYEPTQVPVTPPAPVEPDPQPPVTPTDPDVPGPDEPTMPANPDTPEPIEPNTPLSPGENGSNQTNPGSTEGNQGQVSTPTIVESLQDIISYVTNLFAPVQESEVADEDPQVMEAEDVEQEIDDDTNPLASLPTELTTSGSNITNNFIVHLLLLIVACVCAIGAALMLLFRKSVQDAFADLTGEDLAFGEEKARSFANRAIAFAVLSVILFAAWIVLQI